MGVFRAAAAVFLVTSVGMTLMWNLNHHEVSDITHYRAIGERIAHGGVPYRDVAFEYPPGALPPIVLPALLSDGHGFYYIVFAALMATCGVVGLGLLGAISDLLGIGVSASRSRLLLVALSPLVLGGVMLTRFDLFPVVVLLGGLLALLRGRDRAGFALIGAAIAIKVYPVVLLPIAVVRVARRSGVRAAAEALAIALSVPAVTFGAFAAVSPGGVGHSVWAQLSRPLQIESLGAGVLLALHQIGDTSLAWASASGSQNLYGTGTGAVAALSTVAGAVSLVGLWLAFARGSATEEGFVRFTAASVAAFVTFSKVLSPQYLVWLVFLVPLVAGPCGRRAGLLLAAACIATGVWFPAIYWDLVRHFDPVGSWLVLVRGVLLVGMLATLAFTGERRGQARSPWRARPARR